MSTGFTVSYRLTASEFAVDLGAHCEGGLIEIVDANGIPTGVVYVSSASGVPAQLVAGADVRTRIASNSIAQWSAVYDVDGVNCDHADKSSITTCGKLVGIAANAANSGGTVAIITQGDVLNYTGLSVGPVYLSTSGSITSTIPTTGVLVKLGYVAATSILVVDVQAPIVLS